MSAERQQIASVVTTTDACFYIFSEIFMDYAKEERKIIRKLSLMSIVGNVVLSGFKLFAGIAGNSGAMLSDAVHSLSDVITTVIAFFGTKISQKEADADHPYGHERIESAASLLLGLILAVTGLGIGKAGVEHILLRNTEVAVPGFIALIAAVASIVGKEGMYWYTRYYAEKIGSNAFMADAWHHRSDALSSIGSLIGIGGAMLGYPVMDSIASVVICLFILKVSYDIMRIALRSLLDTSIDKAKEQQLREFIEKQDDVVRVDLLHTRMFGSKSYIDLEICVDGDKTLRESHSVAERVHDAVEKNFPDVKHIMIHLNPTESETK